MSLDFQQVRRQVVELGEKAPERQRAQQILRRKASDLLADCADRSLELREKVGLVARQYDPNLRCALPADQDLRHAERLDGSFPLPALPGEATILAADGSQIAPDRHAEVLYGLVNVGAIQMRLGTADPPLATIDSRLIYDEQLDNRSGGTLSEAALALQRDLFERKMLARLAQQALAPVITFTDGPMELWGAKDAGEAADFQQSLDEYLSVLEELDQLQVITAGYVDKPFATLVVRLLEIAMTPQDQLSRIRDQRPLAGVTDLNLLRDLIKPGERSAVFAIQSKSAASYRGSLALHFFYLNLGRAGNPHIARVEVPAWVADDPQKLDQLHAVLVSQCRLMGSRPYPYLLHRAHETAVVSLDDKAQVTQMIALELRRRGVEVGEISYKQAAKDLAARTRYKR
jgi:hypothetical protein